MDCKRLAIFLSTCTSLGFQRDLKLNPHAALIKCGFHPGEAVQLSGYLRAFQGSSNQEKDRFSLVFQSIDFVNLSGKKTSAVDDWTVGH